MPNSSSRFLDSVLRLQPLVAAFDCDGTLWSGDAGERFFDWEMKRGVVSTQVATSMRARYAGYKAGNVSEDDMCGEMVTMHRGLRESVLVDAAEEFFNHAFPGRIFPEMRELVQRLRNAGCDVWAVSSSNEWVIRAGMKHFGIPENRILATSIEIQDGIITGRLIRIPSGAGKTQALRAVVKKNVDAAFGNSRWDTEMLAMAKHGFAVNPNPDLEAAARERGWTVYFPDGTPSPTPVDPPRA
jgi:HAD superfamily hydrolase (TIGR01490 family)